MNLGLGRMAPCVPEFALLCAQGQDQAGAASIYLAR
jgi:hypothetical protein